MEMTPITLSVLEHRQVADVLLRHERHALVRRPARFDADHVRRHDLADQRLLRHLAVKDNSSGIVALGEDPLQLRSRYDEDSTDIPRGHQLERVVDAVVGRHRMDVRFFCEHVPHGGQHGGPPGSSILAADG